MNLKKCFFGVIILLQILLLTGCSNKEDDTNILKEKGIAELEYIDTKLVSMVNLMNNLSFENYEVSTREVDLQNKSSNSEGQEDSQSSDSSQSEGKGQSSEGEGSSGGDSSSQQQKVTVSEMVSKNILTADKTPKWDEIKVEIEKFYTSWNAIVLDLYKLDIPSEEILNFNNTLDQATLAIKNEQKISAVSSLTNMYKYIPTFLQHITDDSFKQNIANTKYLVVSAYSALESDDWNTAKSELENAIKSFEPIMSDNNYSENVAYSINKTYIILMELQNSVNLKDKDIFYINYKNLMQELEVL